jgi:DNA adenine methylase
MNSPIRYYGGKGTMYNNIIEHFPPKEDYDIYIEPFGGSYSVGLKKDPSKVEIYNDLEQNVFSLYKVLSDKELFSQFKEKCDLALYVDDIRNEYKEKLKEELSPLDRAFYFFYVNRTSHNGIGGFSMNASVRRGMSKAVSDFLSCIDRLPELHNRLSRVIVSNTDGASIIEKYINEPKALIYCDPPYEQSTRTGARYKVDMDRESHEKFLDTVIRSKSKILISGYQCELYNKLTDNGFNMNQFEVNTIDSKFKPKTKVETLWKNY